MEKFKELDEKGKGELTLIDLHKRGAIEIDKYSIKHLRDSVEPVLPALASIAAAENEDIDDNAPSTV